MINATVNMTIVNVTALIITKVTVTTLTFNFVTVTTATVTALEEIYLNRNIFNTYILFIMCLLED